MNCEEKQSRSGSAEDSPSEKPFPVSRRINLPSRRKITIADIRRRWALTPDIGFFLTSRTLIFFIHARSIAFSFPLLALYLILAAWR